MAELDAAVFKTIKEITGLGPAMIARILDRPERTIISWCTEGEGNRKMPAGEVERLCMLLDPKGERQDVIGWVVVAAHARANYVNPPITPEWKRNATYV